MLRRYLLAVALVGCGSSGMNGPGGGDDAPGVDAGNHAGDAPADTAVGPIEVTVLPDYLGDAIADLPVVFNAADGSVIAVETTDATGHASHAVTAPASVTLIKPNGNQGTVTLMAVAPGTALRFGSLWMQRPTTATMRASWPAGPPAVPHKFFDVETRCGGFGAFYEESSGMLKLDARCTGTVDATVAEYYEGGVRAYLTVTGQAIANNGAMTFTGTWIPTPTLLASYTGLPNGTNLSGILTETYDQERYFDSWDTMSSFSSDGTGALVYSLPPAPGSELHEQLTAYMTAGDEIIGRRIPYGDPIGFDIGPSLVPGITAASYDAAAQTVHWTAQPGPAPQVVRASLFYPGADGSYPTWIVVAPGTATSVTPPQLPDSLAQYRIVGTVQGSISLLHETKSYADVVGDIDLWFGRSNIDFGTVDWQGAPADLTTYTSAIARFP